MKATDLALYGIVAFAAYRISRSFSYTIPVQEPDASKMAQEPSNSSASQYDTTLNYRPVAAPAAPAQPSAAQPGQTELEAISLTPIAEKVVKETLLSKRSNENPRFYDLKNNSQSVLLRNFAQDYTSPRMIDDDDLYHKCVVASNATGAPCGWIQIVVHDSGCSDYDSIVAAADCMLNYVDECIFSYRSVEALRLDAISLGRILL